MPQLQDEKRAEQLATGYDICSCTCLSGTFSPLCVKEKKLAARDSWFLSQNKPDDLISLDRYAENDFYLACGILESLPIEFPWLEISQEKSSAQLAECYCMLESNMWPKCEDFHVHRCSMSSFLKLSDYNLICITLRMMTRNR